MNASMLDPQRDQPQPVTALHTSALSPWSTPKMLRLDRADGTKKSSWTEELVGSGGRSYGPS